MEIVRGASDEIKVRIEGNASKKYLDRFDLEAEAKGDTVYIKGFYKDMLVVGFNFVHVDLIVELPDRLWDSVELKSSSANIEVEQLEATTAVVETGSGNINIEELSTGTATIQSKSGSVKAENYKSEQVTVHSNSGNITLDDGTGRVDGETRSGNIRMETDELLQDVTLRSGSGNVRIDVTKEPESAAIHLRTNSGNLDVDWDQFVADRDNEEELSGKIGSGQIKIDLESSTGDLKLGK
ncbi:putative adhesin [Paenibacillus prosopidis]|uniref:Putative adhesin n=2 Tax=Paenibacillus prosopidis TaxID=630520 RepID=A0A368W4I4_9BACL|nr:putative adhesin [Paenibacillus prosopidis]